jgi:uncharacterized membrane protein HdeD (DUF308 family)
MRISKRSLPWGLLTVRGIIGVAFGIAALAWPDATARAIVLLFAIFFLVDGAAAIVFGLTQEQRSRPLGVAEGTIGVIVAVLAIAAPQAMATVLVFMLGIWAALSGIVETGIGVQMSRVSPAGYVLTIVGILSLVFGVVLMFFPETGIVLLTRLLGIYAVVFGLALFGLGVALRRRRSY